MGVLTYSDFDAEIRQALGNRTDVTSAMITRTLNIAQVRIARVTRWEELEVLLTNTLQVTSDAYGDRVILLPDDIRDIHSFRLYDDTRTRKLDRVAARKLDSEEPANEYISRQMPTKYARWAEFLEVNFSPDQTYFARIRAVSWPAPFTGATDETQKSELDQKDDMLIALCVNWLYQSLGNYERSGRWWVVFTNMLESALQEQAEKPDQDRVPSVRDTIIGEYWLDPFANENP